MNQKKDYICVKLKGHEFETFENEAGKHSFYMSPQKWIKETNAIGIISKSGNNGGTLKFDRT